jgi:hypothetical protein
MTVISPMSVLNLDVPQTQPQLTLEYRILHQVLKAASQPLDAGEIRRELNRQEGASPVTKKDVNKVLYSAQSQGHVQRLEPLPDSTAPRWQLDPNLKNEPEAKDLSSPASADEDRQPEPTGANGLQ